MLIEFYGENFGCFRDEFRLSMLATDIDPDSMRGITTVLVNGDSEPLRLIRAAALYGPNASGKSTVLRAARFLGMMIRLGARFRSDEEIVYYMPFGVAEGNSRPVRLGLKAVIEGSVYDYEISFDNRAVKAERLVLQLLDRTEVLFDREGTTVTGRWISDQHFQLVASEFRSNALLLSLADTLVPSLAKGLAPNIVRLLRFFDGSSSGRTASSFGPRAAQLVSQDADFKDWLLRQLRAADFGVTELSVKRVRQFERGQGTLFEEVLEDDGKETPRGEPARRRLSFKHAGPDGPFTVPYEDESFGTRKVVDLSPLFFSLFSDGSANAAFVDEIGASLHPSLLTELIRHFNCEQRSPAIASQLIFATHETSLIDDEARNAVLRRDQVYFTEKDSFGVAKLYSLSDFQERQNINLRKRYLEGRYGAIPSLGHFPS